LLEVLGEKIKLIKKYVVFDVLNFGKMVKKNDSYFNNHVPLHRQVSEKSVIEEWAAVKGFLQNDCESTSNLDIYQYIKAFSFADNLIQIIQM